MMTMTGLHLETVGVLCNSQEVQCLVMGAVCQLLILATISHLVQLVPGGHVIQC